MEVGGTSWMKIGIFSVLSLKPCSLNLFAVLFVTCKRGMFFYRAYTGIGLS